MPELYKSKIPIIRRSLDEGFIRGTPDVAPSYGCIPRDYDVDPVEMRDDPSGMVLIPESDWDAHYEASEAAEDSLEHILLRAIAAGEFEFLDQDGFPDCWAHSTAHALMIDKLKQNLHPVRLNAVAVATLLKQTNGGWSGLSMKFAREHGFPVVGGEPGEWPYQSRRGKDTPELRAAMARHKSLEDWYDLGRKEWDQELSQKQIATCLFNNLPVPSDYNRFRHAMLSIRHVRIERGSWGRLTLNSWQGFGHHGLCVLAEMWPDGAVVLRSSVPSTA